MAVMIIKMYVTLLAPIISGVVNMVWCKTPVFSKLLKPMDFEKNFLDGKRIFGDNKTWKGFVGYIILNMFFSIILGLIWNVTNLNEYNFFYSKLENNIFNNLILGILLGLGYSLFELPNSFLKRRIDIEPGKTPSGFKKIFFVFLDQADSVIGCCLVVAMFYKMSIPFFIAYVLVGAVTHIIFNMLLYFMGLRKNMF